MSTFQKQWPDIELSSLVTRGYGTVLSTASGSRQWLPTCHIQGMAKRILIIDDDEQLLEACRDYLADTGYEVDCARELEEAQSLMTFLPYAVVVTDLRLSKLAFGGLEIVKHVKEQALETRVIVLTAYCWPELKSEASTAGADAFLRKPTRLKELGAAVDMLVGGNA